MSDDTITTVLQKTELELLKKVSCILTENDIDFYLACGTALGCARHKGFIPWDDDVDIYIRGEDYDKVRLVLSDHEKEGISFHDYFTIDNYPYPFPKVIANNTLLVENSLKHLDYSAGVYIDIFPLMQTPNNAYLRNKIEEKRYWSYCLLKAYYFKFNGIKRVLNHMAHIFVNPNKVQKALKRLYTSEYSDCNILIDTGTFKEQAKLDYNWFNNSKLMLFEGVMLPMPHDYKHYLKAYYGNYMQLPTEDQRVSNHHIYSLVINDEKII